MSPVGNFDPKVSMDQIWLGFLTPLLDCLAALNDKGLVYRVYFGYRSFGEQMALWAKGRTQAGDKVTNAGPGDSAHNYGIAADAVLLADGAYDWAPGREAEAYGPLGEEAKARGLAWGGDWHEKDWDHLQVAGYVTAAELAPLKSVYLAHQDAPLSAVFEYLDAQKGSGNAS